MSETLSTRDGDDCRSEASDIPQLLMDPRQFIKVLQICTLIAQGQQIFLFFVFLLLSFLLVNAC